MFILLYPEAILPVLKYTSEMEYIMFLKWTTFFFSFLYILSIELADIEGKKAYQEFVTAKYLSGKSQFCILSVSAKDTVEKPY